MSLWRRLEQRSRSTKNYLTSALRGADNSATSSIHSDTLMESDGCLVERQRRLTPFNDWSSKYLFPTDPPHLMSSDGHSVPVEDVVEDPDWEPLHEEGMTDADGWRYSFNWNFEFSGRVSRHDFVRKRVWVRSAFGNSARAAAASARAVGLPRGTICVEAGAGEVPPAPIEFTHAVPTAGGGGPHPNLNVVGIVKRSAASDSHSTAATQHARPSNLGNTIGVVDIEISAGPGAVAECILQVVHFAETGAAAVILVNSVEELYPPDHVAAAVQGALHHMTARGRPHGGKTRARGIPVVCVRQSDGPALIEGTRCVMTCGLGEVSGDAEPAFVDSTDIPRHAQAGAAWLFGGSRGHPHVAPPEEAQEDTHDQDGDPAAVGDSAKGDQAKFVTLSGDAMAQDALAKLRVLREAIEDNMRFQASGGGFGPAVSGISKGLVDVFHHMLLTLQGMDVMLEDIAAEAGLHDVAGSQGNGLWSIIRVLHCCITKLSEKVHSVTSERTSVFFPARARHLTDALREYHSILAVLKDMLAIVLFLLDGRQRSSIDRVGMPSSGAAPDRYEGESISQGHDILTSERSGVADDCSQAVSTHRLNLSEAISNTGQRLGGAGLFCTHVGMDSVEALVERLDLSALYGRRFGYQYPTRLRHFLRVIVLATASYSRGYQAAGAGPSGASRTGSSNEDGSANNRTTQGTFDLRGDTFHSGGGDGFATPDHRMQANVGGGTASTAVAAPPPHNHVLAQLALSYLHGVKYFLRPGERAARVAEQYACQDVAFAKAFWNLTELPIATSFSAVVAPHVDINRVLEIDGARPLRVPRDAAPRSGAKSSDENETEYVEVHIRPSAEECIMYCPEGYSAPTTVRARLLCTRERSSTMEGQMADVDGLAGKAPGSTANDGLTESSDGTAHPSDAHFGNSVPGFPGHAAAAEWARSAIRGAGAAGSGTPGAKEPSPFLLVHFHGGGFIAQSSASHEVYLREWARVLDCPILSIDYDLAPEHPFPVAISQCFYAYCWAVAGARARTGPLAGVTTAKSVIVAGDSAGGNLAAAVALRVVEERLASALRPAGVCMLYPALFLSMTPSPSRVLALMDPLLPLGNLRVCVEAYADGFARRHPDLVSRVYLDPDDYGGESSRRANTDAQEADALARRRVYHLSPLCAPSWLLRELPPCGVMASEFDPLLDDAVMFVTRMRAVGRESDVKFRVAPLLPHGWLNMYFIGDRRVMSASAEAVCWMKQMLANGLHRFDDHAGPDEGSNRPHSGGAARSPAPAPGHTCRPSDEVSASRIPFSGIGSGGADLSAAPSKNGRESMWSQVLANPTIDRLVSAASAAAIEAAAAANAVVRGPQEPLGGENLDSEAQEGTNAKDSGAAFWCPLEGQPSPAPASARPQGDAGGAAIFPAVEPGQQRPLWPADGAEASEPSPA